jgi:SAM-dependent methyltransferase
MITRRLTLPFVRSVIRLFPGIFLNLSRHLGGTCCVCAKKTVFLWLLSVGREMPVCARCLSNSRQRHLARALIDTFGHPEDLPTLQDVKNNLKALNIYEAQSDGAIHGALRDLPGYVCSEYFDDIPSGGAGPDGIRCEDLQALSFPDDTFDLVITQDVLEHVREPALALSEIRRVLKPGGYHVFTVPVNMTRMETIPLVDVSSGEDHLLGPPVYHNDSIRLQGALAYNDFGRDLLEAIDSRGMETRVMASDPEDERRFRIFQSYVFVSRRLPREETISGIRR